MDGYNVFFIVELVSFIDYMLEGEMYWPQELFRVVYHQIIQH